MSTNRHHGFPHPQFLNIAFSSFDTAEPLDFLFGTFIKEETPETITLSLFGITVPISNIKVEISNSIIYVTLDKSTETQRKLYLYRSLLPLNTDLLAITATLKDKTLTVTCPKLPPGKAQIQIEITE